MKRLLFAALLLVTGLVTGCTPNSARNPAAPSPFLEEFSLSTLLENSPEIVNLQGVGSSHEIGGRSVPFQQKQEEAAFLLENTNTTGFMNSLRLQLVEQLQSYGAEITGSGSGGVAYSFSETYILDGVNGVLNVIGVSGEGSTMTLIVLITEY